MNSNSFAPARRDIHTWSPVTSNLQNHSYTSLGLRDKSSASMNSFTNSFCPKMRPASIFLVFVQHLLCHVAGHPAHGPFEGPSPDFSVGQRVETTSGLVLGQPAALRSEVSEYLGIPFAKPPVGDLRFAAPQAFIGTGNINATAFVSNPKGSRSFRNTRLTDRSLQSAWVH